MIQIQTDILSQHLIETEWGKSFCPPLAPPKLENMRFFASIATHTPYSPSPYRVYGI